jgi:hypothetical protein
LDGADYRASDKVHNEASVITLNQLGLIEPNYQRITTFLPAGWDGDYKDTQDHRDEVRVYGSLWTAAFTPLGDAFCKAITTPKKRAKKRSARMRPDPLMADCAAGG